MSLESRTAWGFLAPSLVLIATFRIAPLIWGAQLSLTDARGITPGAFVGLANYRELAGDPAFQDSMSNTILLIATLPVWVCFPLLLAILIHQGVPGGRFYRATYFMPAILSSVIVGSIFNTLLRRDGAVNALLKLVHIAPVDWLGNSHTALFSLIAVQLWATFGMSLLIFLAGLSTVPQDLIEAATLDGAKLRHLIWHIIIPYIRPIIEFVAVVTTIGILTSMFGLIYVLTAGGPGTSTTLPEFLVWLELGKLNRPGYAAAISMVLFALMAGLAWAQIRIMQRNADV